MSNKLISVTGLRIKKFISTEGSDSKPGNLQIVLETSKDNVRVSGEEVGEYNVGDIVSALNMHQTAIEPVIVQMRFPDSKDGS